MSPREVVAWLAVYVFAAYVVLTVAPMINAALAPAMDALVRIVEAI